jgi:predicted  nucleic acid-binding Zn-ribbon protein
MNQPFLLFQVQKIDTEIDLSDKRLSEIARLLSENQTVLIAEKQKDEADEQAEKAKKALKSIEDAVEKIQIKIQTSESSLYGGKIRLPKELQDLQNEIASLKKHLSAQEDLELEAIMALEQAEKDAVNAGLELEKARAEFASQTAALQGEKSTLEKKKERLLSERGAAISPIQAEFLTIYDRFRVQKRGVAIAGVSEDSCSACGAGLTPANLQAARSNQQIVYCPQCGRMLYGG